MGHGFRRATASGPATCVQRVNRLPLSSDAHWQRSSTFCSLAQGTLNLKKLSSNHALGAASTSPRAGLYCHHHLWLASANSSLAMTTATRRRNATAATRYRNATAATRYRNATAATRYRNTTTATWHRNATTATWRYDSDSNTAPRRDEDSDTAPRHGKDNDTAPQHGEDNDTAPRHGESASLSASGSVSIKKRHRTLSVWWFVPRVMMWSAQIRWISAWGWSSDQLSARRRTGGRSGRQDDTHSRNLLAMTTS
ncbi:hypothetical protein EDB84DRAFT_1436728 [Lactarius hengduanensis]|nr:hypothetical protein EDB84DRAFT_1436728 [Lactarius hengduanensis]